MTMSLATADLVDCHNQPPRRRASHLRQAVAAGVLVLAFAPMVTAQPAFADAGATVMATTQRMSDATLNSAQAGSYSKGSRLTLTCYKRGQSVKGYYSPYLPNGGYDNLWYRVSDGFFVADVDIDTGSNNPVTPACGTSTPAPQASGFSLPFKLGSKVTVSQSPGGSYSHNDAYNSSAVDWDVKAGTPIVASASGVVRFEGWTTGGFAAAGIMILLDHGSDTCTQYAHLSRTVIDNGQHVLKGQLIGYSGATGAASGAHLHWAGVSCNTQKAKFVVSTAETSSYPQGATITSANAGDDLANPRSGRCLDVAGGGTQSGAFIQLYDCNGTKAQRWMYGKTGTSPAPLTVFDGARCLDVTGGQLKSGTSVQSYPCNGSNAQKWSVNANGTVTTVNGLCLDAAGGGTANGTRVQVYTCNGSSAQQWT